jgi:hypothetical protein
MDLADLKATAMIKIYVNSTDSIKLSTVSNLVTAPYWRSSVSIFPGKKFPGKREGLKRPGIPGIPGKFPGNLGISCLNRENFAISRDFPSREFPGTNTMEKV